MRKILWTIFLFSISLSGFTREKVIIDTDPAIGYFLRDVDDGLALAIALNSPELEIIGITTIYGNHTQAKTYKKALEILKEAKSQVPIYRGAKKPGDFSLTPASRFIKSTVLAHPGEITIIAIGPLTNLASAIKSEPELGKNLKSVISMGGALQAKFLGLPPGAFDLNWGSDVKAVQLVVNSVPNFVMISTDLCLKVVFTKEKYQKLKASAPFLRDYLAREIKSWLAFNRMIFQTEQGRGFFPWDTLAVIYLLEPEVFSPNPIQIEIKPRKIQGVKITTGKGTQINAPLELNQTRFWEIFFERI